MRTPVLAAALLVGATLAASGAAANATRPAAGCAAVRSSMQRLVAAGQATAALSRLHTGSGPDCTSAAGRTRLDPAAPAVAPDGAFRIGSVTKTFVAVVVLRLVDEHRLRLDEPIERALPGVVPDGAHITVRQILNHTSGLYDYAHDPGWSTNRWRGADRFRPYRPDQLLQQAFGHRPYFAPGTGWHYSNTNYIVAGRLIEQITGRSYATAIRQRILRPLGLRHTVVPGHAPGLPGPHAHGYTTDPDSRLVDATAMDPSLDWAAGEMISTSADLERFFAALITGRLTSQAALRQMQRTVATGSGFRYGLGLQEFVTPCGGSVFGHSGQLVGYISYALRGSDGRSLVLSVNPGRQPTPAAALTDVLSAAFCDRGQDTAGQSTASPQSAPLKWWPGMRLTRPGEPELVCDRTAAVGSAPWPCQPGLTA